MKKYSWFDYKSAVKESGKTLAELFDYESGTLIDKGGTMDRKELVKKLQSNVCHCLEFKPPMKSFCHVCFFALPRNLQTRLYRRFGQGYDEAYAEAVKVLDDKAAEGVD